MKNTNKTTNSTVTADKAKTPAYDYLKPMVVALKTAHANNNGKAISKDFAAGCGIPANVHTAWVKLIEGELYPVALEWGTKFNSKAATEDDLKAVFAQIFPIWRRLCEVGNESKAHKNLFIRESDGVRIATYAVKPGWSYRGTIETAVAPKEFRRSIETMLGIRMAQNAVLTVQDYEIMVKYEKAEQAIEKAENMLNGYDRNGTHVKGLHETLEDQCALYAKLRAMVVALGVPEKEADDHALLAGANADIKSTKAKIAQATETISKAKEAMAKREDDYKRITKAIEAIK